MCSIYVVDDIYEEYFVCDCDKSNKLYDSTRIWTYTRIRKLSRTHFDLIVLYKIGIRYSNLVFSKSWPNYSWWQMGNVVVNDSQTLWVSSIYKMIAPLDRQFYNVCQLFVGSSSSSYIPLVWQTTSVYRHIMFCWVYLDYGALGPEQGNFKINVI